jgi:hypothetical protein
MLYFFGPHKSTTWKRETSSVEGKRCAIPALTKMAQVLERNEHDVRTDHTISHDGLRNLKKP